MHDTLEGYREGETRPLEGEDLLRQQMQLNRHLIEAVHAGEDLKAFLATPAGRALLAEANQLLFEAITEWLNTADPGDGKARNAHFNARVSVSLLQRVANVLQTAQGARVQVEQSDRQVNSGEPHVD